MFEAAFRSHPGEHQAYLGLGAYNASNGPREAIENYDTAVKLANRRDRISSVVDEEVFSLTARSTTNSAWHCSPSRL
jgi:hypothetical protein